MRFFATFHYVANDRFKIPVISTIGEIYQFEEISPRILVEMTALMRLSVIHSLFPFKKWVNSQNDSQVEWSAYSEPCHSDAKRARLTDKVGQGIS